MPSVQVNVADYTQRTLSQGGAFMVGALVSRSRCLGWSSGRGHRVVFLGDTLLSMCLSTQVYKRVPANLMLG